MRLSVLQMVQSILSSLSSDEVNSIGDTAESLQIANIIQTVYYNMAARAELPEHEGFIQLQASDDPLKPVLMTVPANVTRITWMEYYDSNPADASTNIQASQFGAYSPHDTNTDLQNNSTFQASFPWTTNSTTTQTVGLGIKAFTVDPNLTIALGNQAEISSGGTLYMSGVVTAYFNNQLSIDITAFDGAGTFSSWTISQLNAPTTAPGYRLVQVIHPYEFIKRSSSLNQTESDTRTYDFTDAGGNSFVINYKNNSQPKFCCFVADRFVLFDSFDGSQDSTLQGSKTLCWGWFIPDFILEDNFIPNLNDYQFPLLIAEAKTLAFFELKQMQHPRAELEARRQWSNLQKNKSVTNKPSYFNQLPNFGRTLYTGGYATGFPYNWTQGYQGAPW